MNFSNKQHACESQPFTTDNSYQYLPRVLGLGETKAKAGQVQWTLRNGSLTLEEDLGRGTLNICDIFVWKVYLCFEV